MRKLVLEHSRSSGPLPIWQCQWHVYCIGTPGIDQCWHIWVDASKNGVRVSLTSPSCSSWYFVAEAGQMSLLLFLLLLIQTNSYNWTNAPRNVSLTSPSCSRWYLEPRHNNGFERWQRLIRIRPTLTKREGGDKAWQSLQRWWRWRRYGEEEKKDKAG